MAAGYESTLDTAVSGEDSGRRLSERVFLGFFLLMIAVAVLYPEIILKQSVQVAGIEVTPLVAIAPFAAAAFAWYFIPRWREVGFTAFDAVFLAALAYTVLRAAAAATAMIQIKMALEYAGYAVIAYYGAAVLFRDRERLRQFLWFMTGLLMIVSLYEVLIFILGRDPVYGDIILERVPLKSAEFFRGGSTLAQPVYLGAFLLQAAPLAVWGIFSSRGRYARWFAFAALAAAVVAGVLSFSRGAWVIGGLMAVAIIAIEYRRFHKMMLIALAVPALILLGVLAWHGDLAFHVFDRNESNYMRDWSRERAFEVFRDNPVFGVGLFKGMEEIDKKPFREDQRPTPIDNFYISALIEEGVVGAALYVVLLALLAVSAFFTLRRGPPAERLLPLMLTLSLLGVFADALFFDAFLIWPHFILFWAVAGTLRAVGHKRDAETPGA